MRYEKNGKTITSNDGKTVTVWTSNPFDMNRLDRWATDYPQHARLLKVHRVGMGAGIGSVDWKTYEIRACLLQFFEPDEMTSSALIWDKEAITADDAELYDLAKNRAETPLGEDDLQDGELYQ